MADTAMLLKRLLPFSLPGTDRHRGKPYLQEKGWVFTYGINAQWNGYYRTRFGSFKGRIVPRADPKRRYFIHNPPERLHHHHWACFSEMKGMEQGGWYAVHLLPFPKDIVSGVLAIERVIDEAFKKSR